MKIAYPRFFSIILLLGLGAVVYSNTFWCSFHFDDKSSIIDNAGIRDIHHLQDIWNCLPRRFLLYLSLALNYHCHQLDVFGYHLFNLTVHLLTAVLVWWLVLLTLSTPALKGDKISLHANTIALLAGLVFVSHPVQTEAVTYIVQRAASMAALFYILTLCLYVKSRYLQENQLTPGLWKYYYAGSLIAAVMAMFCKETAITLPLMILFYEYSFLKIGKTLNWKYLTPFLLMLFIIPLTMLFTESAKIQPAQDAGAQNDPGILPWHYLLTQWRVMVTYVRLSFLPLNQNLDYDYPISRSLFEGPALMSFLFLTIVLFWARRLFSKYRLVSFSIFWFFLTLLPESSFLPIKDVIFEHRLYLPLAGYAMFLVSGAYYLLGKNNMRAMVIMLTMIVACNSVLTFERNKVWKDEITLWDDAVRKSPHKARPHNNRGLIYNGLGQPGKALSDYNEAIEINPRYAAAYLNRGVVRYQQGDLNGALSDFSKAIQLNPGYAGGYGNRGHIYDQQGDLNRALSDFNKALEIDPETAWFYTKRGIIDYKQGRPAQALSDFSKALQINPDDADARNNRAVLYYQSRDYVRAWADVRRANASGARVNADFMDALKAASGQDR